ncbi:hypothetical protein HG531_009923 [Fusarium graminearum]|nr:hypothetical protein HG531_009923 [Fusarium graminearum]
MLKWLLGRWLLDIGPVEAVDSAIPDRLSILHVGVSCTSGRITALLVRINVLGYPHVSVLVLRNLSLVSSNVFVRVFVRFTLLQRVGQVFFLLPIRGRKWALLGIIGKSIFRRILHGNITYIEQLVQQVFSPIEDQAPVGCG